MRSCPKMKSNPDRVRDASLFTWGQHMQKSWGKMSVAVGVGRDGKEAVSCSSQAAGQCGVERQVILKRGM